MIKTEQVETWSSKINFIDKNDVFVGYDMEQCCCEDAGYVFLSEPEEYHCSKSLGWIVNFENEIKEIDLSEYIFDVDYFEDLEDLDIESFKDNWLDAGGQVFFKLISDGKPDVYLSLYNAHNGYYGHGFNTNINGQDLEGHL